MKIFRRLSMKRIEKFGLVIWESNEIEKRRDLYLFLFLSLWSFYFPMWSVQQQQQQVSQYPKLYLNFPFGYCGSIQHLIRFFILLSKLNIEMLISNSSIRVFINKIFFFFLFENKMFNLHDDCKCIWFQDVHWDVSSIEELSDE